MNNLEKQNELAKEAINLIKEFANIAQVVRYNSLQSISANTEGNIIVIVDEFEGQTEYTLTDISNALSEDLDGGGFYNAIEQGISEAKSDYSRLSKEDFINAVGNLYYVECRSEEIYERLKAIEKEALEK